MLAARTVRELTLASGARPYLAAASGLVGVGQWLYVIADDEASLGIFPASGSGPGRRLPLFDAGVPEGAAFPKAAKPDLEVLEHTHGSDRGLFAFVRLQCLYSTMNTPSTGMTRELT